MTIVARETPRAGRHPGWESALERRALALWPRLERRALRRCGHDPTKIAELVARRTSLPPEAIVRILLVPQTTEDEIGTWFG